jgi:tryptophan synthase beta subunit
LNLWCNLQQRHNVNNTDTTITTNIWRLQQIYDDYNKDTTFKTKIQRLQQIYDDYNKDTTITTQIKKLGLTLVSVGGIFFEREGMLNNKHIAQKCDLYSLP